MFAEDIDLLPAATIYKLVDDCVNRKQSSYDLFGGLFAQMNNPKPATGGRFKGIPYFNGGLFSVIEPIDLMVDELLLVGGDEGAAAKDWSKVNPAIFGTIFQQSMDTDARHAYGAHFTSEADILRIVSPTIVRPWQEKINSAGTMKELLELRKDLVNFRVLDPACGSGNFLYISYRELVRLELSLLSKLKEEFSDREFHKHVKSISLVSPKQLHGIDRDSFGVELAKVTLMLAKKLALDEAHDVLYREQVQLDFSQDDALPLDNLDDNVICDDALFVNWPDVHAIVGNPPYQSKNKMQAELGRAYVNKIRKAYPDIPGRADYCVYWFRKTHDHLKMGRRAGLVGTNTIRQNYSRTGGLDYIVSNGGTITEAVSTMKWSGEAVVYVSVVNWLKGDMQKKKRLYIQEDDNDATKGWRYKDLDKIGPSLSFDADVTSAQSISANAAIGRCFQGQTHGHEGFLLKREEAEELIKKNKNFKQVLYPYLIANEMIGKKDSLPARYVIDFGERDLFEAKSFGSLFERVKSQVLPDRQAAADREEKRNAEAQKESAKANVSKDHANALKRWWLLFRSRQEMISSINKLPRYIACGRVTRRPIFEFVDSAIHPNDALMVFPFADDYSFGILQSIHHWVWFINRCSTLKGDPRYTSNTVFDSFPWPQSPSQAAIKRVAYAAKELRVLRRKLMQKHDMSLRELYRSIDDPGKNPLSAAQISLDDAVYDAYGFTKEMRRSQSLLELLLELNEEVVAAESSGISVLGPGLPQCVGQTSMYISNDCLHMP